MKRKKILGLSLLSFATLSLVSGLLINYHSLAEVIGEGDPSFDDVYHINEEIEIPDYYITVGGERIKADKRIITPSKRVYRKNSYTPTERGLYTVSYTGENFRRDFSFQVDDFRYYLDGDGEAAWKANEKTPNNEALNLSLEAGTTFHLNEVVNIKELGSKRPLINFYYVTETPTIADVYTIKIRFTDAYDSSKYLQLEVEASREGPQHGAVYLKAAGENQTPTGYEANWDRLHVGTIFGYPQNANAYCCTTDRENFSEAQYVNNTVKFYFDYETMVVSSNPNFYGQTDICDLNNSKFFTEFWEGMTTGECRVSIWYENVLAARPTICVTDLAGANLKSTYLMDDENPTLEVNNVFGNLPDAIVNHKYRFLSAKAVDQYDGMLEPEIKVYRDYYTSKTQVPTEKDGFIPHKLGIYYIEYKAVDHSGNTVTNLFELRCVNEARDFDVNLVPGYLTSGFVGKEIEVADITTSGNIGEAIGEVFVVDPNGNEEKINHSFTPATTGVHIVKYVVTDFIGTKKEVSYNINVTVSEAPIINDKPSLLKYYLAGFEYTLPDLYGIDFNVSETTKVKASIAIIDGGTTTPLSGNKVTFNNGSSHKREVTIRYTVSNSKASESVEYVVNVMTTSTDGYIHMDKYFDLKDANVSATKDGVTIGTTSNGGAIFTNPLAISNFNFDFKFVSGHANFSKFNVYLIDSLNENEMVKVSYLSTEGKPNVIVNDNDTFVFEGSGVTSGGEQFVKFDIENYKVSTNTSNVIPVKNYLNGEVFNGFSSDAVYVMVEFENAASNDVQVMVTNFNGQGISSTKFDYIQPRIVLSEDYGGARDLNENIKLCTAKAFDVLDPCPTVSVSAFNSLNQYVNDLDGNQIKNVSCEVEHIFKVGSYGNYRVSYTASDYDDNQVTFSYSISVYDRVAPTIRLVGSNPTTAALNSSVRFATATISDNVSSSSNIVFKLYVISPTGYMTQVNNYTYTFTSKGKYVIQYFAVDEAGNVAILNNEIIVG